MRLRARDHYTSSTHWWNRQRRSKFASHYTWGTNKVCECKMEVCWEGLSTLSFGLSQLHGRGIWLVCGVALIWVMKQVAIGRVNKQIFFDLDQKRHLRFYGASPQNSCMQSLALCLCIYGSKEWFGECLLLQRVGRYIIKLRFEVRQLLVEPWSHKIES
jgi:hypothetical protein